MSVFVYTHVPDSTLLLAMCVVLLASFFVILQLCVEAHYSDPYIDDEELARLCDGSADEESDVIESTSRTEHTHVQIL